MFLPGRENGCGNYGRPYVEGGFSMNERALRTLEYNKIITQLTEQATSAAGKELCRSLMPSVDLEEIQLAQRQTADALSRI